MNFQTKEGVFIFVKNRSAIIKLSVSMAIFGSIGFFTIHTGIPALELVFIRCICATIILTSIWCLIGQHKKETFTKKNVMSTIVCGVFLVLNWVFLFKAFEVMSISIAITLYNLAPIFLLIISFVFLRERLNLLGVIATALCFLGSILIIGLDHLQSVESLKSSGFIWSILSAVCYALTMLTSKRIEQLSSYALTFIQTTVGILMLIPFCDFSVFQSLTTSNWLYIIGTGVIHTGFVYYLFFDSVRTLPTFLVSVFVFIDPLVAILLDVVILSFIPSTFQIIGMGLIFGGILGTVLLPNRRNIHKSTT